MWPAAAWNSTRRSASLRPNRQLPDLLVEQAAELQGDAAGQVAAGLQGHVPPGVQVLGAARPPGGGDGLAAGGAHQEAGAAGVRGHQLAQAAPGSGSGCRNGCPTGRVHPGQDVLVLLQAGQVGDPGPALLDEHRLGGEPHGRQQAWNRTNLSRQSA